MKLALYINSLGRGGAERVSLMLLDYFNKSGIDCIVITERKRKEEYDLPKGIRRVNAGVISKYAYVKNVLSVRKIIKKENPDKILIMDTPNCLVAIPALCGLRIEKIIAERNDPYNFQGKKIVKILSHFMFRFGNKYVFQTKEAKEYYSKAIQQKSVIIPNPLDVDALPKRDDDRLKKEIVAVGRLTKQKNQTMAIKAFSKIANKFQDYNFVIYGEGELRSVLEKQIDDLGLRNQVFLPGNEKNVLDKIKNASLFVMPSKFEGMPNALIEAMAIGIPSISTDCSCGGPRFLIDNGKNGFLVGVDNVDMLADKIEYCLKNPNVLKKVAGESQKVRVALNVNVICEKWLKYIFDIISEGWIK